MTPSVQPAKQDTQFTPNQLDAIDYRSQDACVVAGPGSGKTTVLVQRYRELVEVRGFEPRHILAITFTEKAAANMKAKLAELFEHDQPRLRELESAYVSTIHGFCARLLRDNAIAAGIDPRFVVLDARESEELQFACLHQALDELVEQRRDEALQLIAALHRPDLAGDLRKAYDAIRSAGKTIAEVRATENPGATLEPAEAAGRVLAIVASWQPGLTVARLKLRDDLLEWARKLSECDAGDLEGIARLVASCPPNNARGPGVKEFKEESLPLLLAGALDRHTAPFRGMVFDVLARFEQLYDERKIEIGSLDFNDLERRSIDLLRGNREVAGRTREQFRQVMLDEFQDINAQQSDLIDLIRSEDVFFAVGDVNQSIYGFRHSRPEIFDDYLAKIREAGKHSTDLLRNFRSRAEILRCVEALLNAAEGIQRRDLVAGSAFTDKTQPSIEVLRVLDDDKDEATLKEARWIAHRILDLRSTLRIGANGETRSPAFRDFAVLCRNSESMKPILEAFNAANIPYVCGRRQSFLLSREGLDITALLHTIANPRDGIALATVLRSNLVGLGDEALLRVRLLAGSVTGGLNLLAHDTAKLAEFEAEDARKIERFAGNLKRWRAAQPVTPLEVLLVRALRDCGFEWAPDTVTALNIENFLHLARARGDGRGLTDFLREIESLREAMSAESDLADRDQADAVQVMTAHSAKGLEFPVTIIAAMDKGTQRNSAPVTFTPEFGLGLTWKNPGGKPGHNGLDDSWQLRNAAHLKEREKREGNRLLYVAMTRAEEHLILSYSRTTKKRPSYWAKLIEDEFHPDSLGPTDEPRVEKITALNGDSFEISVRVTEAEPPALRADAADPMRESGVLRVPRPAVDDQHDAAVNVTSLTVFADCPRKYYLQRYIGWNGELRGRFDAEDLAAEADDDDRLSAADLGSAVHEILAGSPDTHPEEARRLADVFVSSELGRRAAAATRAGREWDFIVDIDGTLVRGTVDLWFEENGEIILVDYKTDIAPSPEAYAPQLALYALALERALGKRPLEAWLFFLRSQNPVRVPVDDGAIQGVRDLLARLLRAQNSLRFELNEGEHCRGCRFYRSLCPAN